MVIEINPLTPAISVKVISFFEISFVTRKIVSGTTGPRNLFCARYDQIPVPCPPPRLSCQNYFLLFVWILLVKIVEEIREKWLVALGSRATFHLTDFNETFPG